LEYNTGLSDEEWIKNVYLNEPTSKIYLILRKMAIVISLILLNDLLILYLLWYNNINNIYINILNILKLFNEYYIIYLILKVGRYRNWKRN